MKVYWKKSLVLGIIFLFLEASFIPSVISLKNKYIKDELLDNSFKKIFIVDDEGDTLEGYDCYSNINDAITEASDGDEIWVYSGDYYNTITLDKHIILKGIDEELPPNGDDTGKPRIVANDVDYAIKIISDSCYIYGFNISTKIFGNHENIGIYLSYSNKNNITENEIIHNNIGIELKDSNENIISKNYFNENVLYGLGIGTSYDNTIIDNTFARNIVENFLPNGLIVTNSDNFIITNNLFTNCGFSLSGSELYHYNTHIIDENFVNGKPIYYYKNNSDITVPSDAGEVILANCYNFVIQSLNISNVEEGIFLAFSNNNTITFNNLNSGVIDLFNSYNNSLISNNIRYCDRGINIYNFKSTGPVNLILSNNFFRNLIGISFGNSANNKVISNFFDENNYGLMLDGSDSNNITSNNFSNNNYGVYLEKDSNDNIIYLNNFLSNNISAYDKCTNNWSSDELMTYVYNNTTYSNYQGNFWGDYTGVDENPEDGIGDSPYSIVGGNNKDYYPLWSKFINLPPLKPSIYGPTKGNISEIYTYTAFTKDPNGNKLYYKFDWGDGSSTGWLGSYSSGNKANSTHKWIEKGTYNIRVKSKDVYNVESEWSDHLIVNIPRIRMVENNWFDIINERYPILFTLIEHFIIYIQFFKKY